MFFLPMSFYCGSQIRISNFLDCAKILAAFKVLGNYTKILQQLLATLEDLYFQSWDGLLYLGLYRTKYSFNLFRNLTETFFAPFFVILFRTHAAVTLNNLWTKENTFSPPMEQYEASTIKSFIIVYQRSAPMFALTLFLTVYISHEKIQKLTVSILEIVCGAV